MRALHIIMPMAGEGSRFRNAGWSTPKPLIELNGKPLFVRAIESVRVENAPMKYSFIVRQEHINNYDIDKSIRAIIPDAMIYSVETTTGGAVETCLKAETGIADDDAIVVMDCDLEFNSSEYRRLIETALNTSGLEARGGALVSFNSDKPKYSYAEVSEDGFVKRTAEKEVISNHALCGAYFFASGRTFKSIAHRLLDEPVKLKPEFYVSLLYNYLLADDEPVRLAPMEMYHSYGTPDELLQYINNK